MQFSEEFPRGWVWLTLLVRESPTHSWCSCCLCSSFAQTEPGICRARRGPRAHTARGPSVPPDGSALPKCFLISYISLCEESGPSEQLQRGCPLSWPPVAQHPNQWYQQGALSPLLL